MAPVICQTLSNGVKIPAIMLGTYRLNSETAGPVIEAACRAGYRAFDCAEFYKNEDVLGPLIHSYETGATPFDVENAPKDMTHLPSSSFEAIEDFDQTFHVPHGPCKNRMFVTTKIWPTDYDKDIAAVIDRHLKNFQRDSTDLVLMHWPGPHKNWGYTLEEQMDSQANEQRRIKVWRQLEFLYHRKLIRAIGVSNFMPKHLQPLIADIEKRKASGDKFATPIMINQVEGSPWIHGFKSILNLSREHHFAISAYRPLGGDAVKYGRVTQRDVSDELAEKYKVPKANVLIRWVLQKNLIALPKSATPARIVSNRDVFSFELTAQELEQLDKLHIADANLNENPNDIG